MGSSTAQPPVWGLTAQRSPRCTMAMATTILKGEWSEDFTDQGAIGEEGGKAFGGKHALKEADAALEFGHAVEKHKAARAEAEQEQTDVRFATHE